MDKCAKKVGRYKIGSKFIAFLLMFGLMGVSVFGSFLGLLTAQTNGSVNLTLTPGLDKYGMLTVNEDGTFYPCDRFEISYSIEELSSEVSFERVEFSYDSSAFSLFSNSSGFGLERVGGGCFEVLSSAPAGMYSFAVTVWGTRSLGDFGNENYVIAENTVTIQVVEYDPHFTVALAYTVLTGNGSSSSSYEKPFAIIVRYDGNGQDRNLRQRAVIDDYTWEGYAQKIPEINAMQQSLTPNITVASFFNQSSNTQFLTQGLEDAKSNQIVLWVDEKSFTTNELPVGFLWESNTPHRYIWTQNLSVDRTSEGLLYDEWFEWQSSIVFPPSINSNQNNQTTTIMMMSQEDLQNQLVEQFNSPNGTLITSPFGNTVTAMYAHNRRIDLFAKDVGVSKNQTLKCLTPTPLYFTSQERYAKLQYALDSIVVAEITNQGFTNALYYNLTVGCNLFGTPRYFETNTTCEYEFFDKLFNTTAYRWDATRQVWSIDPIVNIEATFTSALNFTTTDILRETLETQTTDKQALELATIDLYDSGPQIFKGTGTIEANLKRSNPLYYNLIVEAGQKQKTLLQRTVQLNFRDQTPYNLPLNFDTASPIQIKVVADDTQSTLLLLDAPIELGGLTNITTYLITKTPTTAKTPNDLSGDQLELRLLKTLNLTIPQAPQTQPLDYEQNYQQFYQYYEGYSSISQENEGLGFCGQAQIAIPKDKSVGALTDQGEAMFYVEATNVWGTTFHQIISVQPYSASKWTIPFNEVTVYLVTIVVIAVIVSLVIYLIKANQ